MMIDIAIFHARTGQVTTVVPEGPLPLIQSNLSEQFMAEPVERHSVNIGTVMPMTEQRQARIAMLNAGILRVPLRLRQQRLEDCVCVECGDPNLETRHRCPRCAQTARERVARSSARSL